MSELSPEKKSAIVSQARLLSLVAGRNNTELTPEDRAELEASLANWPELAQQLKLEQEFESRIAKTMLDVAVPTDLKHKIEASLSASNGAGFRRKTYWAMGMAASLLLVVGAVSAYRILYAPTLNLNELIAQADGEAENPRGLVENYLGHTFAPEMPINLNLLATVGSGRIQNRDVPMLYLRNASKNVYAKVYVITSDKFRIAEAVPVTQNSFYGHKVEKLRDQNRKDVIYLVVFTGDSLTPFLDEYASH